MKKFALLSGILFFTIALQAQTRRIATPQNKKPVANRILSKKNATPVVLDSTQFKYHNAYLVGLYFSKFYLAAIDFHPSYITNGTSADTKIEYAIYSSNGELLANYTTNSNPWPTDPYNRHPIPDIELQAHGGHKIVELMNKSCMLKISLRSKTEDSVEISRFTLLFKDAQNYYPDNPKLSEPEYSTPFATFITQWHQDAKNILLTKEHPTAILHFQYNKNLVSAYSAGTNTVFIPIY